MKKILFIIIIALLVACTDKESGTQQADSSQQHPLVICSNYPLYFFTTEIAGEYIDVRMPVIDGDPAMWAPNGVDVADLQDADLLILNGAGYESWLAFTTLPREHILDTSAQLQSLLLPIENETVHQHGPAGKHSHPGTAFTTWLDPQLAIAQAGAITQGLSRLVPEQTGSFEANFEKLKQKLNRLDQSLNEVFALLEGQPVIFSHPVYQYLQHRYKINGRSAHWEPDSEPGTRDWIDFGKLRREHPAEIMIWEASPLDSVRQQLLQMDIKSVVFEPAGNRPEQGGYFEVMEQNLLRLKAQMER